MNIYAILIAALLSVLTAVFAAPIGGIMTDAPFFENKTACCFTGHRPAGLPPDNSAAMTKLRLLLVRAVQEAAEAGVTCFLCGGAEGFDTMAAESVLAVQREQPALALILALPSRSFFSGRSQAEQERANATLLAASKVFYASESSNSPLSMIMRNRYLVDHADCCVAYLKQSTGGTLFTVNYALRRGIPVKNLAMEP